MNDSFISRALLILVLIGLLAGCSDDETPEPTVTPMVVIVTETPTSAPLPTDTPVPTEVPVEAAPAAVITEPLFDLPNNVLSSYRTRGELVLTTIFDENHTEEESLQLEGAYIAVDSEFEFDQFFVLNAIQAGSTTTETVAIYQVDDVMAAYFDGEWRTADRRDAGISLSDNPFNQPLAVLTNPLPAAEEIGSETIAGLETIHYRITEPDAFIEVANINMAEGQSIEDVQIDLWVAQTGNYIVKYVISATVNDALDVDAQGNSTRADQQVAWNFELFDIGEEVEIELPAEAPDPQAFTPPGFHNGNFPIPTGAHITINPFGQTEIITTLSEEEVVNFYVEILHQLGWKFEGAFGLYEVTKENLAFDLITLASDQGGTRIRVQSQ